MTKHTSRFSEVISGGGSGPLIFVGVVNLILTGLLMLTLNALFADASPMSPSGRVNFTIGTFCNASSTSPCLSGSSSRQKGFSSPFSAFLRITSNTTLGIKDATKVFDLLHLVVSRPVVMRTHASSTFLFTSLISSKSWAVSSVLVGSGLARLPLSGLSALGFSFCFDFGVSFGLL